MTAESEPSSDSDSGTPIRASFSMHRGSREAIRWVAERYGMDQSDIVNLAPVLFVILAEGLLNKRRGRLSQLETVVRQAERNVAGLGALAPHLRAYTEGIYEALDALLEGERHSIEQNQVLDVREGIGEKDHAGLLHELLIINNAAPSMSASSSPIISAMVESAKLAGISVSQDTGGVDGRPEYAFSLLFKLEGGDGSNLAIAAHDQTCMVTTAGSMDEFLAIRNEDGSLPRFLVRFMSLLG